MLDLGLKKPFTFLHLDCDIEASKRAAADVHGVRFIPTLSTPGCAHLVTGMAVLKMEYFIEYAYERRWKCEKN